MHLTPARTAARAAAISGALVLGLAGSATAAMASPGDPPVLCNVGDLIGALINVPSGGTLTLADDCTYYLEESLVDTKGYLTIIGNGSTLEGGGPHSGFAILGVPRGKHLTLDGVSFAGGSGPDGGAISNAGHLTVNGGVFSDNSARYGGAIDSGGYHSSLTIRHAVFNRNSASVEGGAVAVDSATTIIGAIFSHNSSHEGGAFYTDAYPATVKHTSFLGNVAYEGGAIRNDADLTLTDVSGLRGSGNTFSGNRADRGGAIYNHDSATIDDSLIMSNRAQRGGGLYNDCEAAYTLSGTTFYKNVTDNIYVRGC